MKKALSLLALAVSLQWDVAAASQPLHRFEADSFKSMAAAHRGQAFVVMFWSLDCEYCLASFKSLEEARRQTGLRIVTVATDSALDTHTAKLVTEKLREAGLQSQAWAFGAAAPERLRYAVDPKWRGELPRTYWFDPQGKMKAWSGVVTPDVVQRFRAPH